MEVVLKTEQKRYIKCRKITSNEVNQSIIDSDLHSVVNGRTNPPQNVIH